MDYKQCLQVLKENTPYDFSDYSDNSIKRRLQKVIADSGLSLDELFEKIRSDKSFVEQLVEKVTVNTTEWFRDPDVWLDLYQRISSVLKKKKTINIWHAGSSSCMEVYSNMIILSELGLLERSRIFASDISIGMIRKCKKGQYRYTFNKKNLASFEKALEKNPLDGLTKIDFSKYFDVDEQSDKLVIKDILRDKIDVRHHNMVHEDTPFYHKFDVIFCRNVLIYFNTSLQSKIYQMFHTHMYPGGALVLGNHESMTGFYKTKFKKSGPFYIKTNEFHFKY